MKNERIEPRLLRHIATEEGISQCISFKEMARHYYAGVMAKNIAKLKQSYNPDTRAIAEILEFLVDTYRQTG